MKGVSYLLGDNKGYTYGIIRGRREVCGVVFGPQTFSIHLELYCNIKKTYSIFTFATFT